MYACARALFVYETNPISLPIEDYMTITAELQTRLSVHYVSTLHSMYGSVKYAATFKWNLILFAHKNRA